MRFFRHLSLLLLAILLSGCNSCHKPKSSTPTHNQKTPPEPTITSSTTTIATSSTVKTPPPQPEKIVTLKIYYEKEPIPESLLQEWSQQSKVKYTQAALKFDINNQCQHDGDLYVVSPRLLAMLKGQMPLNPVNDRSVLKAINPAYTSQPFDANNQFTVPWRWTPYVFYLRHDKDLPWDKNRVVFYFREWINDPRCLWPNDWDLLLAMEIHYQGHSANRHLDNYAQLIADLKTKYSTVTASENDCWQALQEGKINFSFLPASLRIKQGVDEKFKDYEIQMPGLGNTFQSAYGTIVYMDQLIVAEKSEAKEQTQTLIGYLMQPAQQQRLIQESGYFPVVTKLGHEFDSSPIPLPKDHWFNRSEFLVNRPPELPAPPPTVITPPVTTATSATTSITATTATTQTTGSIPVALPVNTGSVTP